MIALATSTWPFLAFCRVDEVDGWEGPAAGVFKQPKDRSANSFALLTSEMAFEVKGELPPASSKQAKKDRRRAAARTASIPGTDEDFRGWDGPSAGVFKKPVNAFSNSFSLLMTDDARDLENDGPESPKPVTPTRLPILVKEAVAVAGDELKTDNLTPRDTDIQERRVLVEATVPAISPSNSGSVATDEVPLHADLLGSLWEPVPASSDASSTVRIDQPEVSHTVDILITRSASRSALNESVAVTCAIE